MSEIANILLVDDNKMDVVLALDAFKEAHLANNINVVYSGEDAIDYLFGKNKYANRQIFPLPDIILLDLKMPGISGIDVLKKVKNTQILKRIPIIILTSSKDEGDRAMGYDYGANSYLVKPISFAGFLDVVESITTYWLTLNIMPPIE